MSKAASMQSKTTQENIAPHSSEPNLLKPKERLRDKIKNVFKKKDLAKQQEDNVEKQIQVADAQGSIIHPSKSSSDGSVSDHYENTSSSAEEVPDLSKMKLGGFSLMRARRDARHKRFTHPKKAKELEKSISKQAFELPPDTSLTEDQIDNLVIRMLDPKTGIPIGIRKKNFKTFPNCFSGEDATQWLTKTLKVNQEQAVQLGQTMFMNRGLFFSISSKHTSFYNKSDIFYRFRITEQEDVNVLNMAKLYVEEAKEPVKISQELSDMAIRLLLVPHKKENFKAVLKTRMFKKFVLSSSKLQKVNLEPMNDEEKRLFFINIHNVLMVHCYILFGFPKVKSDYELILQKCYMIGNLPISISLLRSAAIGHLSSNIPADIPRKLMNIPTDPLVHFCLFYGDSLSPTVRTYSLEEFEEMSEQQAKQYIIDNVVLDKEGGRILLPKFFETFVKDFGGNRVEFIRNLSDYYQKNDRDWMRHKAKEVQIVYQEPTFTGIQFIKENIILSPV